MSKHDGVRRVYYKILLLLLNTYTHCALYYVGTRRALCRACLGSRGGFVWEGVRGGGVTVAGRCVRPCADSTLHTFGGNRPSAAAKVNAICWLRRVTVRQPGTAAPRTPNIAGLRVSGSYTYIVILLLLCVVLSPRRTFVIIIIFFVVIIIIIIALLALTYYYIYITLYAASTACTPSV